jgi:hypothetical protein
MLNALMLTVIFVMLSAITLIVLMLIVNFCHAECSLVYCHGAKEDEVFVLG